MLIVVALAQWWRVPVSLWRALGMALLVVLLITPLDALSASLWVSLGAVACIARLTRSHATRQLSKHRFPQKIRFVEPFQSCPCLTSRAGSQPLWASRLFATPQPLLLSLE
ncbi:hypothetical protein ADG881_191 [Alcanivorax sp. DG881]|nr:hypothetical protein ADG881_191 [Alcanivorax sp. DG881]